MKRHVMRLGDGRCQFLPDYMKVVKFAFANTNARFPRSFQSWVPCDGQTIIQEHYRMIHGRINQHDPAYGKGRKWTERYQSGLLRDARRIQEKIQIRVRVYQFETPELRRRFAHLLSSYHEDF